VLLEPLDQNYVVKQPGNHKEVRYTQGVQQWDDSRNDATARNFSAWGFSETYLSNTYQTAFGQSIEASTIHGDTGLPYPGRSGQTLSDVGTGAEMGCKMWEGWFSPLRCNDYVNFPTYIDNTVSFMDNQRWIDQQTSLVSVSIGLVAPAIDKSLYVTYAVEFTPAGFVRSRFPQIAVTRAKADDVGPINWPFLFATYYMMSELQDIMLTREVVSWPALMSWLAIFSSAFMFGYQMRYLFVGPSYQEYQTFTYENAQQSFQAITGFTLFFVTFNFLRFTRNVPIMVRIGNTAGHVFFPLLCLLAVLSLLFLAFGALFNLCFVTSYMEFSSLRLTMFGLFRGLVGDIDAEALQIAQPTLGPLLYIMYLLVVLFIVFTLVIGLLASSYAAVKDFPVEDGVVHRAFGYFGVESTDTAEDPDTERIVQLLESVKSQVDRLEKQQAYFPSGTPLADTRYCT